MASRKRTYKTVQVCVSPERHAELKAMAEAQGIALSKLAGDLLDEALRARRKGRINSDENVDSGQLRKALAILRALDSAED